MSCMSLIQIKLCQRYGTTWNKREEKSWDVPYMVPFATSLTCNMSVSNFSTADWKLQVISKPQTTY